MSGLFYQLGKKLGSSVRKGEWIWHSLTGREEDRIEAEERVGEDLARAHREGLDLDAEAEVAELLESVGSRLVARVKNKRRRFHFYSFLDPSLNAFALPGGHIFITRTLVERCERNPDEIAFVLGHEMGHVIKQHAIERVVSNAALGAALKRLRVAPIAGQWIRSAGAQLLQSAYSQGQELEADRLGKALALAAGFDEEGPVRALSRLEQCRRDPGQAGGEDLVTEYLSSHPPVATRIRELRER